MSVSKSGLTRQLGACMVPLSAGLGPASRAAPVVGTRPARECRPAPLAPSGMSGTANHDGGVRETHGRRFRPAEDLRTVTSPFGGAPPGRPSFAPSASEQAAQPGPAARGGHRRTPGQASPRPYGRPRRGGRRFRRSVSRALQWIFMDAVSARFGTLVIGLVLARMMAPAEFGAFGVVVIALLGVHSVGQLGVGGAIISWRDSPREIAPTVMTISVACSAALYAACYVGASALLLAMGAPAAAGVIRYIALSVVISGVVAAPRAMIERQAPRRRLLVDQVDNWLAVAVTIGDAARRVEACG